MDYFVFNDIKLQPKKNVASAFSKVYGLGRGRVIYVCKLLGISPKCRLINLNLYYFSAFTKILKRFYGTDIILKRIRDNNLNQFLATKSYKSIRYAAGLPIRGQRTRTNAKTRKRNG